MSDKHLPLFGIGPLLCFPQALVTAVGIFLSSKGILPFKIENKAIQIIMLVVGIILIIEGLVCYFGADFGGGLVKSIKSNKLKTNGSYSFVRNPCYVTFLLGCTGAILISHNLLLLTLPPIIWAVMTIVLINTEEKWLTNLYGQEYLDYCKRVNRCIPWLPKK